MIDLAIRGGLIFDGSGGDPYEADIGVENGRIAAIGSVSRAREEIDARGQIVTPGFVDIHSHYDGQVTWSNRLSPSSAHGVTTVLTGNCGVGFAPCREADRNALVELMEGVEDIPEVVMSAGLPWKWESFPEYLDFVGGRQFDVDVGTQLPHSALRLFAMGARGANRELATDEDLALMSHLAEQAMRAGALGFATSNTLFHRTSRGEPVPTLGAAERELTVIAAALRRAGHGAIEMLADIYEGDSREHVGRLARIERAAGHGLSFTLAQAGSDRNTWRNILAAVKAENEAGARIKGQVIGRPIGILLGHSLSYNCFHGCASYAPLRDLPLSRKLAPLRDPALRAKLLSEIPAASTQPIHVFARNFERVFRVGLTMNYEPSLENSLASEAARKGVSPLELAYDIMLEDEGLAMLYATVGNYADGTLDHALELMQSDHTVLGLGDGGAHYGLICDASYPTHMLTYWARDRPGGRMDLASTIGKLTRVPAEAIGLNDRGRLAIGYRADINVIDQERLTLYAPQVVHDLPAGGQRLVQHADGYNATIAGGVLTYRHGVATGALPGRLVRGPQPRPRP